MSKMQTILLLLSLATTSCLHKIPQEETQTSNYDTGPKFIQNADSRTPAQYPSSDPSCTADRALKNLGTVPISIEGTESQETVEFNFEGVSGDGLKNQYNEGVISNYRWDETYNDCQSSDLRNFNCIRSEVSETDLGGNVLICKIPSNGFPIKSLENAALVTLAGFMKTIRTYMNASQDIVPSKKIGISLFPNFVRTFHLIDGTTEIRYDVDNARYTNRNRKDWASILEFLPHSKELLRNKKYQEYWLQFGVISHEVGHHIFAERVPKLKVGWSSLVNASGQESVIHDSYYSSRPVQMRDVDMTNVVSALDEGYADLVAHFTFSSAINPYFQINLGRTSASRKVNASQIEIQRNNQEEKALTAPVLKHFFSRKRTYPPANTASPDHQDEHAIGAIVANALDSLFGIKVGHSPQNDKTLEKYRLVNQWLTEIEKLYLSKNEFYEKMPQTGYNKDPLSYMSGPAKFLEDAMFAALPFAYNANGALSKDQCETLELKFPLYVQKWQGLYKCE